MASKLGSLFVSLGLNTAEFNKNLSSTQARVRRSARRMRRSMQNVENSMLRVGKAMALVAGPAALGYLTVQSFKTIDAVGKMADATGIATESLTAMHTAANLAGVESQTFDKALIKMSRSIRDANAGLSTYTRAYEALGINTAELQKLTPEQQFNVINDALGRVGNSTERLAIATDIYGARAATMLNMTNMNSEAFYKMKEELITVGAALNRIDTNKVEQANDAMTKAMEAVKGLGNRIAVALAPYITAIADQFYQASLDSGGFADAVSSGMEIVTKAIGYVLNAVRFLEIGWKTLNVVFQGIVAGVINGAYAIYEAFIDLANVIPGVNMQVNESFKGMAEATAAVTANTYKELEELTMKPLPSEGLQIWADNAEAQADRVARAFVKTRKTQEAVAGSTVKVEKDKNEKLGKDALKAAKDHFGITKAQRIAEAAANIPAAISGAYKIGAGIGGPVVGAAFGAAAGAFEAKKLAEITGISFGGGGGGGSSGGGGAPSASLPTQSALTPSPIEDAALGAGRKGGVTNITVNGVPDDQAVDIMIDRLNEAVERGDKVIFSRNSRQAQELRGL